MVDLKNVSTIALASELALRRDLLRSDGLLHRALYDLRKELGAISTVDGVPIKVVGAEVTAMAGVRNTGPEAGKLCTIGGVVAKGEDIVFALKRQFKSDLNVDIEFITPWYHPALVSQHRSPTYGPAPRFLPEPTKPHCLAKVHLVEITNREDMKFGTTSPGGQEFGSAMWMSLENLPGPHHFGYGQWYVYQYCLQYYDFFRKHGSSMPIFNTP